MTDKQKQWQSRRHILWRLKGIVIPISTDALTTREYNILITVKNLIKDFNTHTRESSEELGFHTHKRCPICGKAINDNEEYCNKHKQ